MTLECEGIFDSHAHYFDARFDREVDGGADAILHTVLQKTVQKILNVGTDPATSRMAVGQAARYPGMYAAVGLHPENAHGLNERETLEEIEALLGTAETRRRDKIAALGEIGLDYHAPSFGGVPLDRDMELRVFREQLRMAERLDLPVIIHNREANGDLFETLLRFPRVRGVLHSFGGSPESVREYTRRGWYISFSGTVTFKNAPRVREALLATPRDRLLLETDCPYLAPHPVRGTLNHSGRMVYTVTAVADILGCEPQEIADLTRKNAENLFSV